MPHVIEKARLNRIAALSRLGAPGRATRPTLLIFA
jgi:hypothetical protein